MIVNYIFLLFVAPLQMYCKLVQIVVLLWVKGIHLLNINLVPFLVTWLDALGELSRKIHNPIGIQIIITSAPNRIIQMGHKGHFRFCGSWKRHVCTSSTAKPMIVFTYTLIPSALLIKVQQLIKCSVLYMIHWNELSLMWCVYNICWNK